MSDNDQIDDELFIDAVTEVLNIGMGNAAASLSEMVDKEVLLSLPSIAFISHSEAVRIIDERVKTDICGVSQYFQGAFSGNAMLIFPEKQSLELVRMILQQNEMTLDELSEMEQEAMVEIGNVILNACLSSMADLFGGEIQGDIPNFIRGSLAKALLPKDSGQEDIVLLLNINFSINAKKLQGHVTFLMDVQSAALFKKVILDLIGD